MGHAIPYGDREVPRNNNDTEHVAQHSLLFLGVHVGNGRAAILLENGPSRIDRALS
jgi:hypothetical protein